MARSKKDRKKQQIKLAARLLAAKVLNPGPLPGGKKRQAREKQRRAKDEVRYRTLLKHDKNFVRQDKHMKDILKGGQHG